MHYAFGCSNYGNKSIGCTRGLIYMDKKKDKTPFLSLEPIHIEERNNCQYVMKGSNNILLYEASLTTIDGIVKYDCGEGQKIFNKKEFHPTNKEEILDKQLIDSFSLSFTEKDCLKSGTKLSDDNYQICWCEKVLLSSEGINKKKLFSI